MFCKFSVNTVFCTITCSLLSGNVNNFQFLQGQEKQLTELAASVLQNSVWISQFLKRKSHYLFTLWVAAKYDWNHYPADNYGFTIGTDSCRSAVFKTKSGGHS